MWRSHVVVYGITRQSLCRKGPFIIFTGGGGGRIWGGSCLFDKLKGGVVSFFVVFLVLKSGFYMPNHVFGVSRPMGPTKQF